MYANGVEERNKDNLFVLFVAKVVHLWYVDRPTACHVRDAPISKVALNQPSYLFTSFARISIFPSLQPLVDDIDRVARIGQARPTVGS